MTSLLNANPLKTPLQTPPALPWLMAVEILLFLLSEPYEWTGSKQPGQLAQSYRWRRSEYRRKFVPRPTCAVSSDHQVASVPPWAAQRSPPPMVVSEQATPMYVPYAFLLLIKLPLSTYMALTSSEFLLLRRVVTADGREGGRPRNKSRTEACNVHRQLGW
jgi:hypothetical protein